MAGGGQETEGVKDAMTINITPQYCQDVFDMLIEGTYETIPNGVLKDFIDHSLQSIDWSEVLTHVKDTITES